MNPHPSLPAVDAAFITQAKLYRSAFDAYEAADDARTAAYASMNAIERRMRQLPQPSTVEALALCRELID